MNKIFAKTKILATVGPAIDTTEKLEEIIDAGCDAFRLNFSHGNLQYFEHVFNLINEICVRKSLPIPILIDLQGPKIRIGELCQPSIEIKTNDLIEITVDDVVGTAQKISTSYKQLHKDAELGNTILVDDGLINLKVTELKENSVICKIIEGGVLKPKKGMNLPGMNLSTSSITEKDYTNLEFALKHRVDFIALSFVRSADDIKSLKDWLKKKGISKSIIAKIEKPEAVENFDSILEEADGIMIARGDLGVELAPQIVPIVQKRIIRKCNAIGKLVITATQMLESMIHNPIPTRAEASDIANAVFDGTDVVMLSGETSVGSHAIEAVKIMNNILLTAEAQSSFRHKIDYEVPHDLNDNIFDATGRAIVSMSSQLNASALVIFTHYGKKARTIAKFRPNSPIYAFSDKFDTLNALNLYWGIKPFFLKDITEEDKSINNSSGILIEKGFIKEGDFVIYSASAPFTETSRKSWTRFELI